MTAKELILTHILKCSRADLYIQKPQLNVKQQETYETMIRRLDSGEPLQYILGECEFMGYPIKVDPRVLIPRPETELLVEMVVREMLTQDDTDLIGLEIGVGSGNIMIALLKQISHLRMKGLDVSASALEVSLENMRCNQISDRAELVHADVFDWLSLSHNRLFSFIVSNPPYVRQGELQSLPRDVQREPVVALDGGEDGLRFYRWIISKGIDVLKPGGWMFFEIGEEQGKSLDNLLTSQGSFVNIAIIKDYNQKDRFVKAQLSL